MEWNIIYCSKYLSMWKKGICPLSLRITTFDRLILTTYPKPYTNTRELSRESRSTIVTDHHSLSESWGSIILAFLMGKAVIGRDVAGWVISSISYRWIIYTKCQNYGITPSHGPWPVSYGENAKVLRLSIYNWNWSCSRFDKHSQHWLCVLIQCMLHQKLCNIKKKIRY